MSQELVDKVVRTFDAWNRGDLDAWLATAHPEIEWHSELTQRIEGAETVYRGAAGLRRYWEDWHSLWDVEVEITDTLDHGDTVAVLAQVRTRGGASGVALEGPIAYVLECEGGLVRRVRSYLDQQDALDAVSGPGSGAA